MDHQRLRTAGRPGCARESGRVAIPCRQRCGRLRPPSGSSRGRFRRSRPPWAARHAAADFDTGFGDVFVVRMHAGGGPEVVITSGQRVHSARIPPAWCRCTAPGRPRAAMAARICGSWSAARERSGGSGSRRTSRNVGCARGRRARSAVRDRETDVRWSGSAGRTRWSPSASSMRNEWRVLSSRKAHADAGRRPPRRWPA